MGKKTKDGKRRDNPYQVLILIAVTALLSFSRFDPWSLLNGFKNKALDLGVTFVKGETVGFEAEEMTIGYKVGIGDTCQRLKRIHVRYQLNCCNYTN